MRRTVLVLALLAACQERAAPPPAVTPERPPDLAVPRPAPTGPLAAPAEAPEPAGEARGIVGPTGSLGVEVYRKRRRVLLERIKTGAAMVDAAWDEEHLRVGSSFYYLTGVDERGASLLLEPQAPTFKEVLFLQKRDVENERVDGERAPIPSRALELATGIGRIARDGALPGFLVHACSRWNSLSFVGEFVPPPREPPREMVLYRQILERVYDCKVASLRGAIARMRIAKEPEELALMRKAIEHTAAGHAAALAAVRPGAREYQVKLALEDAFHRSGSRVLAFPSIVGSGPNSAVLHYPQDDREMKEGELVVVDIGAEAEHYAADITRTLPVSGKYAPEQREIYDIVLRAQAAGIAAAHAGVSIEDVDRAARKVIEDAGYYDYFIHGCCHTVGLDVHDSLEDRTSPLPAGAVITVEPGIYLPQRGFGIRIEDEILITPTGAEVLTAAVPKDPAELERLMAGARK